jgi:hypothetical protein
MDVAFFSTFVLACQNENCAVRSLAPPKKVLALSIRLGLASSFVPDKTHKSNCLCAAPSNARYFGNLEKKCF